MKKFLFLIIPILFQSFTILGQARDPIPDSLIVKPTKRVITVGLLQGGSILGADVEFRLIDGIGLQVGAGLIGFGGGLNFHFNPDIKSSCISMMFMHQGFGNLYFETLFGPAYIQRWQNGWSAQLGVGFLSEFGPLAADLWEGEIPTIQPFFGVGYYF